LWVASHGDITTPRPPPLPPLAILGTTPPRFCCPARLLRPARRRLRQVRRDALEQPCQSGQADRRVGQYGRRHSPLGCRPPNSAGSRAQGSRLDGAESGLQPRRDHVRVGELRSHASGLAGAPESPAEALCAKITHNMTTSSGITSSRRHRLHHRLPRPAGIHIRREALRTAMRDNAT
jgi:hypothetical protein